MTRKQLEKIITDNSRDIKINNNCYCNHTMYYCVIIGDSCLHIMPHPTKKQYKKYIKPMLEELEVKYGR